MRARATTWSAGSSSPPSPPAVIANGSKDAVLTPTFEAGKGYGNFDVISSLGGTLPLGDTIKLGRTIVWNTTAQYKLDKYLLPELESNATYYFGGKNDGKSQNFLEPGLTAGKFKIHPKDEIQPRRLRLRRRNADRNLRLPHLQPRTGLHQPLSFLSSGKTVSGKAVSQ